MSGSQRASLRSRDFWLAFLVTMRPYLIFVSGTAGLVGLAFIPRAPLSRLTMAFIPLLLSYGLGQALTDCFQTDTDALSSPYRPLVKGVVSRRQILAVSLTGLGLGVIILALLNPVLLAFGLLAVLGLLTYTILKRTWWGGPPWNSWIVALLPIMGRLVEKGASVGTTLGPRAPLAGPFWLAVAAVFFGYANFVVMGYFKDISADRATGYRTFPVVFGWQRNAVYSDILAAAAALATGAALLALPRLTIAGAVSYFAGFSLNIAAQVRIHRHRDENAAHGPIAGVVRSFILYGLALVLTLQPGWTAFAVAFCALFEVVLKARPEERQV